jgi:hypothetical protein
LGQVSKVGRTSGIPTRPEAFAHGQENFPEVRDGRKNILPRARGAGLEHEARPLGEYNPEVGDERALGEMFRKWVRLRGVRPGLRRWLMARKISPKSVTDGKVSVQEFGAGALGMRRGLWANIAPKSVPE